MNLKTTLALLVLAVAGGVLFWKAPTLPPGLGLGPPPAGPDAGTIGALDAITPDNLRRIEIEGPSGKVMVEKSAGGEWSMPGNWPTRKEEVQALVKQIGDLRSRFVAVPINDETNLARYGLKPASVTVTVTADNKTYRLDVGEEKGDSNRSAWPTYLRLPEPEGKEWKAKPEIVRLGPGLVAFLDRPADYYQQRRLFPSERVARAEGSRDKVDQLSAEALSTQDKDASLTVAKKGDDWRLSAPFTDRPEPEALKKLLRSVADVWAEKFVATPNEGLSAFGLDKPERTITVTRPGGDKLALLIGDKSPREVERIVSEPAPPGAPFPVMRRTIKDTFRYAKLADNPQVFEIRDGQLHDVFVSASNLRDPKLAQFKPEQATKLEIKHGDKDIVLVKKDTQWRLQKPLDSDADVPKINELLEQLAGLQARGDDIKDKGELKEFGLETPSATVSVTVDEPVKGSKDPKATKSRTIKLLLGGPVKDAEKVFVQVDGWPRVNAVSNAVVKLVDRPALAYRGRGLFDFDAADLAQIEVQRAKEKYVLKQVDGKWQLAAPVVAEADPVKMRTLAAVLGRLGAIAFVSDTPTDEELARFGLAKPAVSATLTFSTEGKQPRTLQIGAQKPGANEFYAKMSDAPAVFLIPKIVVDDLDRDSLAYRPLQIWQLQPGDVTSLRIDKQAQPAYKLERDAGKWKLTGPFDATVSSAQVDPLLGSFVNLKAERFEAHQLKDLPTYGLDKPFLALTVNEGAKVRTLLIGKPTEKDATTRFAKLAEEDAVFVIGTALPRAFEEGALGLLDRNLLTIPGTSISRVSSKGPEGAMTIERLKDSKWQVEAGDAKFTPDFAQLATVLSVCSNLRASRFADYGAKVELAKYGLDKPAATLTITVQPTEKEGKPVEHTLLVGKTVEGDDGERYARLDDGPGIVVLNRLQSGALVKTYLDYVDRTLLKLEPAGITSIARKMGDQELELAKRDDGWSIIKPAEFKADDKGLERLVDQLARLKALRIVAYPAKDLKKFGLDTPTAVVTLHLGEAGDKGKERILKIGGLVPEKEAASTGERYVLVDGADAVGAIEGSLAQQLIAPVLGFRDRQVAKFSGADKAIVERGPRKTVFTQVDGTWKLTDPVEADAEHTELQEFIDGLTRFRADDLVAEKPADVKMYGLDRPQARWQFLIGDKEVLGLIVGGYEKGKGGPGSRAYAKLGNGDLVFLLSPTQTSRALAEYRSRNLWPPLDPNHIEKLEFKYPKTSFTLELIDGKTWQIDGKPDTKVNTAVVNDTLAALGGLKAQQTVTDKDPDLKLYGLDAPQLTLEIHLRSGAKRVLQIGRSEGDSKRSYARVTDPKRGDVFIISEADGERLLRKLADFTGKKE